jgi:hypothetical protein
MNPKIKCEICNQLVPTNIDGSARRHDRAYKVLSFIPFETEAISCPGGSDLVGILMSDPMARAIGEGRKSVTRRDYEPWMKIRKGDRAYVRETTWVWCLKEPNGINKTGRQKYYFRPIHGVPVIYHADHPERPTTKPNTAVCGEWRLKLGRFMRYQDARLFVVFTEDPRREPVRDISDEEAIREGAYQVQGGLWTLGFPILPTGDYTPRSSYLSAWEHLHPGTQSTANPVCLAFERIR